MPNVLVIDKKTGVQVSAASPTIALDSASTVVISTTRGAIKQMTRDGQSLVIEFLGGEKLVIKPYFDGPDGEKSTLVIDDAGQLTEVVIAESSGLGDSLVLQYEPFEHAAAEAANSTSVLEKLGAAFGDLSTLSKGAVLAGAGLGVYALTQAGGSGGGGSHNRGGVSPGGVDTTAPDAPQIKVGTKANGTMSVSGTAEPGSRIDFTFPDGSKKSVMVGADASFSLASDVPQPQGTYSATATDAANNASKPTTGQFIADPKSDTTPPATASDLLVKTLGDGKMTITGKAEPGSTVDVKFPDGTTGSVIAKPDGSFTLTSSTSQPNGDYSVTVSDAAGNKGTSVTGHFTADPAVDITPPAAPAGLVAVTLPDGKVKVSGSAEANSKVTVTLPDGTTQQVTAGPNGAFELTSNTAQPNGTITAVATDAAGNPSAPATVSFVADNSVDTTPPPAPTG
ncbi:Ig-like domain-containing protein, partial [Pseudomonas sp. B329]|uniref:Ig-like domain-containing protein n=1 Tax=Pseudomonas sp. B329 TaxID=1553459 RepID=UPI0020054075